jgi:beta-mannan synthase
MSVILLAEKVFLGVISAAVNVLRRRSGRPYKCDPIVQDDETGSAACPMVLVQIPMYNEKEVRLSP